MKKLRISHAELAVLRDKMKALEAEDAVATAELADTTNNGAETWHDNAGFDAAKDKKNLAGVMMAKMSYLLQFGEVVEPSLKKVEIGTHVTYLNDEIGTEHTIHIAGDAAWLMPGDWASHAAPLAQILLNGKVGQTCSGELAGEPVELTILMVEKSPEIS